MEVYIDHEVIDKQLKKHPGQRKPFENLCEYIESMTEEEFRVSKGLDGHPIKTKGDLWSVKMTRGDRVEYKIIDHVVHLYSIFESHEKASKPKGGPKKGTYTASALIFLS